LSVVAALYSSAAPASRTHDHLQSIVAEKVSSLLSTDGRYGVAIVVLSGDETFFFAYGRANQEASVPVTPDSLFNLASVSKVFDTTLLGLAVQRGEMKLDDPVSKYVPEISGKHSAAITLRQIASHTSGFTLPQDHPPWPEKNYTWSEFVDVLNAWVPDHEPGTQLVYSHGGFMLLHVVIERALGAGYSDLLDRHIAVPLGLTSTTLPKPGTAFKGVLPPALKQHAVQGYSFEGKAAGEPGEQQGFYHWPGTGQMYSSARDMSLFLAANLGKAQDEHLIRAMQSAQQTVFQIDPATAIGLAWERQEVSGHTVVAKYGSLYNSAAYIAFIPDLQLGVLVLCNRGGQDVIGLGREIMGEVARLELRASTPAER
jgi:beta-lactamase class C